jgi:sec-independent protein translocase protein TatB
MFDFAWSEIALIGVVALVLIGPKDLPIAIKTVTTMIKKARRMAAEFQTHVDDMVKDADLSEVRDQFREIRSMDIRGAITRAVDGDGSIREAFKDPLRSPPPVAPTVETPLMTEVAVETKAEHTVDLTPASAPPIETPAFIPPANAHTPRPAPAFIPPEAAPPSQNG